MMTRQDFEKLATTIDDQVTRVKASYPVSWRNSDEFLLLEELASDIADVCEGSNGMFDRDRFLRACGTLEK